MPYKHITKIIPRELNRNVKLSLEDREKIKEKYQTGKTSQRKLAREYNVSRRLIQFIIDPSKEEKNKKNKKNYYDKNKHKKYMKKHRKYKQQLYLKGDLK